MFQFYALKVNNLNREMDLSVEEVSLPSGEVYLLYEEVRLPSEDV